MILSLFFAFLQKFLGTKTAKFDQNLGQGLGWTELINTFELKKRYYEPDNLSQFLLQNLPRACEFILMRFPSTNFSHFLTVKPIFHLNSK